MNTLRLGISFTASPHSPQILGIRFQELGTLEEVENQGKLLYMGKCVVRKLYSISDLIDFFCNWHFSHSLYYLLSI